MFFGGEGAFKEGFGGGGGEVAFLEERPEGGVVEIVDVACESVSESEFHQRNGR